MRGFWADEKKDGGSWNMGHPVFKRVYHYYKKKEKQYLQNADCVISLTEAGKKEILTWKYFNKQIPLAVIPCCADMKHFSLTDNDQKQKAKYALGVPSSSLLISYLGSIGTWYMLDEMLLFYKQLKIVYDDAKFIFVTHTPRNFIDIKIAEFNLDPKDIIITSASRAEVPSMIKASDINISFIKPVYSKISSSPTKLGEVLSMGIPVIVNNGVGDVKHIVEETNSGFVINGFSENDFAAAINAVPVLLKKQPMEIRYKARKIYDLETGIGLYADSYNLVLS
jgi:glycosyltransferase involved in cell wall biosynthesis